MEDDFTKIESLIILTTIKYELLRQCILHSIGFEYVNSHKYHSQQTRQYTVQYFLFILERRIKGVLLLLGLA